MATEHAPQRHVEQDERPSERVPPVLTPGSDDVAFLANLNEVYGEPDPDDAPIVTGIHRSLHDILKHEP